MKKLQGVPAASQPSLSHPFGAEPVPVSDKAGIANAGRIPDRRPSSCDRTGIKLIINHEHVALVLRVKQQLEDLAA